MRCKDCTYWPPSAMGGKPCCFCYPDTVMDHFRRKGVKLETVGNTEFTERAKRLVEDYTRACRNEASDPPVEFEVYVVWNCYILGNMKALLSTTIEDGMYYEVTFNKAKNEIYLDAYKHAENVCYTL